MIIGGYYTPYELLKDEFKQKHEEGFRIPSEAETAWEQLRPEDPPSEKEFETIYKLLDQAEMRPDFPFVEPDDLHEIRKARPNRTHRKFKIDESDANLLDRFHGAWLGRSVGCALGKPVESMGMWGEHHHGIRQYLLNRNDWPLKDYFSGKPVENESHRISCPRSQRENIAFMESDDDIRYTLVGLLLLEQFGKDFTSENVAGLWNQVLPMNFVCTAERQALLNYNMKLHVGPFQKEWIRKFNNPYREWIGAQIRADFFGFVAAGNPELAAEFAWRDASWTHVKNGIYGEMFIAALEAAAFVTQNPQDLVEIALGEIPENCRLAHAVRNALAEIPKHKTMESFMKWFEPEYADMSPVHTINNAVICTAALFFGEMNPDRSVCEAVMGGLDTDCNGATVGAITGIAAGFRNFGGTLSARLNDTIRAEFGEFQEVSMQHLAERTLAVFRKLQM